MKRTRLVFALVLLGACESSPRTVERPQIPPPGPSPSREVQASERQQAQDLDEEATQAFLEQEIERNKPPEPVRPSIGTTGPVVRYEDYPYYYESARDYQGEEYASPFPWNTAIGAGVGAIIGHQSGHRGEGAAIGAGVGLLLDLARWNW